MLSFLNDKNNSLVLIYRDNLRALIRDSNNISLRSDNLEQLEEWVEVNEIIKKFLNYHIIVILLNQ